MAVTIGSNLLSPGTTDPNTGTYNYNYPPTEGGFWDNVYYDDNGYPIVDPWNFGTYGPPQGGVVNVTTPGGTSFTGTNFVGPVASGAGITPIGFGDSGSMITPGGGAGVIGGTLDNISTSGGFTPGHGSLDPNLNPTIYGGGGGQLPNIGIGIPGIIGVGTGGLIYGGLLGGGSGGSIFGGGGGQQSNTGIMGPVVPGAPSGDYPQVTAQNLPQIGQQGGGTPEASGVGPTILPPPPYDPNAPNQISAPLGSGLGAPTESNTPNNVIVPPPVNTGGATESPKPTQINTPLGTGLGVPAGTPEGGTQNPVIVPPVIPGTPVVPPTTPPVTNPQGNVNINLPNSPYTGLQWNGMNRNYFAEGNQGVQDLSQLGPQIASLYGNLSGQYGNTDFANYQNILGGMSAPNDAMTGLANLQTRSSNLALRQGNLMDVQQFGQQALGARQSANQELYSGLNRLDQAAGQGVQANQGQNFLSSLLGQGGLAPSAIQQTLEAQAAQELGRGRELSAEDTRMAQQSAREAGMARGRGYDMSSMAAEVLNRDSLARQRESERRAFASGVDAQGFQQRAAAQQGNIGLGSTLGAMDYGRQQQGFNQLLGATQARTANAFDPFGTILGSQYGMQTSNAGTNQQLFGQTTGFSSGALGNQFVQNAFNPYNNYANDVYGSNFNAANARAISEANNQAAVAGARNQQATDIATSLLGIGQSNNWFGAFG